MSLLLKVNVNVKENDLEWLVTHKRDHPFFKKKIVWKDLKYTWNIRKQFSILNPEIQSWEKHYPEVRILWWMWMFKSTILHGLRHIRRSTPLHWVPFLIYVIITVILVIIIILNRHHPNQHHQHHPDWKLEGNSPMNNFPSHPSQ